MPSPPQLAILQKPFPKQFSTLVEHVDAKRVLYFIKYHVDKNDDKTIMNEYYNLIKNGKVICKYSYGFNCEEYSIGRMYCKHSLQSMPNKFRAFVVTKKYHDIDIVNCNPTILLQLFTINGYYSPRLQEYVNKRDEYLTKYSKEYNVNKKTIKKGLNALIFGKSVKTLARELNINEKEIKSLSFIQQFSDEVTKNCKLLIQNENYHKIVTDINTYLSKKGKNKNYWPSIISYMVLTVENNILASMVQYFTSHKFEVSTLIFDGCHVQSDDDDISHHLRACEKHIFNKTGFRIKLIEKPLTHGLEYNEIEFDNENISGIAPVEISENDVFEYARTNISFENQKKLFEKNHFKILYPTMYYSEIINENGEVELHNSNFAETYQSVGYTAINDKKGDKTWEVKPFIKQWLQRADLRVYEKLIFNPDPNYIANNKYYNTFRGFYWTRDNSTPNLENIQPLLDHILNTICSGNKNEYEYLLNWMAFAIQKPHIKTQVAVVLMGLQGVGKGTIVDYLSDIMGKQYYTHPTSQNDVLGNFNSLLAGKTLVFLDEITWGGDKQTSGNLKKLITEQTMSINKKGVAQYEMSTFSNFIFASNNYWAFPAEKSERRCFIPTIDNDRVLSKTPQEKTTYFNNIRNVKVEHWAHFLYNRDISTYNPREVIVTKKQREQESYSYSAVERWFGDVLNDGFIRIKYQFHSKDVSLTSENIPKTNIYEAFMASKCKKNEYVSSTKFWMDLAKLVNYSYKRIRINDNELAYVVTFLGTLDEMREKYKKVMMSEF